MENKHQNEEEIPVTGQPKFAGFWIRLVSHFFDGILLGIPMIIIQSIILMSVTGTFSLEVWLMEDELTIVQTVTYLSFTFFSHIVLSIIYYAVMESSKYQGTLGKLMLGLKVTDEEGNRIGFWTAFGRLLSKTFLSGILFIGYIMVAFTKKKQGLHDLIVSTVVIKK
jgi:uncharacterized RDD family membrane protein YckC